MPDGERLPNLVFVMNYRFLPQALDDAYLYGVVQHVARAGLVSEANGARVGLILYDRDPTAREPEIDDGLALGRWPFVRIRYRDAEASLRGPIEQAIDAVHQRWGIDPRDEPFVLYFQTGSLVRHAPDDCRVIVTHHSPFVRNVAEVLGWEATRRAFDWDHAKTDHLERTQADGLAYIGANPSVRCAEISAVQRAYLLRAGVAEHQIMALPPPLASGPADADPVASHPVGPGLHGQPSGSHAGIDAFVRRALVAGRPPVALLAVSRFDHFKNAELFLEATAIAIRRGHVCEALVIGGHDGDLLTEELKAAAAADLAGRITFFGRLPRSVLVHGVFVALRASAVFVCCSRFDLVPYTALEAARAGVPVIAPDSPTVGVSAYLPPAYRFDPSAAGLAAKLGQLGARPGLRAAFEGHAARIAACTSDEHFAASLRAICDPGNGPGWSGR